MWVDASGRALEAALDAGASVKINHHEARGVVGAEPPIELAYQLSARSGAIAVVTDGAAGAVAAHGDESWCAHTPSIEVVNATASGDAFFGGMLTALGLGEELAGALALGVAAGSACASRLEPGVSVGTAARLRLGVVVDSASRGHQ